MRSLVISSAALAMLLAPGDACAMGFRMLTGDSGTMEGTAEGRTADCPQYSVGISFMSARNTDIQSQMVLGYRNVDSRKLLLPEAKSLDYIDMMFGLRYMPRNPTLWLGDSAVFRLTAAGSLGFSMGFSAASSWDLPVNLSAGFAISSKTAVGVMVEGFWRPTPAKAQYYLPGTATEATIDLEPFYGARAGFFW